jgi:hypothetical protein
MAATILQRAFPVALRQLVERLRGFAYDDAFG